MDADVASVLPRRGWKRWGGGNGYRDAGHSSNVVIFLEVNL